ncbi:MAG: hypothetical protein NDI61_14430 [Bdellovibrionaceae bacterium]|nr:hypothetical protein [Pseudobdellovibrionaceae bacterium]
MDSAFYSHRSFLCIDGPARLAGQDHSKVKVGFTCRDLNFLSELIAQIAKEPTCYWAKISSQPRDGMYFARCFFTTNQESGRIWAKYKSHPRLLAYLQDDEFASAFRNSVHSWKNETAAE